MTMLPELPLSSLQARVIRVYNPPSHVNEETTQSVRILGENFFLSENMKPGLPPLSRQQEPQVKVIGVYNLPSHVNDEMIKKLRILGEKLLSTNNVTSSSKTTTSPQAIDLNELKTENEQNELSGNALLTSTVIPDPNFDIGESFNLLWTAVNSKEGFDKVLFGNIERGESILKMNENKEVIFSRQLVINLNTLINERKDKFAEEHTIIPVTIKQLENVMDQMLIDLANQIIEKEMVKGTSQSDMINQLAKSIVEIKQEIIKQRSNAAACERRREDIVNELQKVRAFITSFEQAHGPGNTHGNPELKFSKQINDFMKNLDKLG